MTTILISTEQIKETKMFRSLNPLMQKITLKRYNLMALQNSVNAATSRGFEKWNLETHETYTNRMIVKEIIES